MSCQRPDQISLEKPRLRARLRHFAADKSGAVSIDWVVLAAGCLGLALAVTITVGDAAKSASGDTSRCLKIQKRIMARDNLSYKTKMKRIKRRCGRL